MSSISIETKKISDLSELSALSEDNMLIVNDNTGMKKVSIETLKKEWEVSPTLRVTVPSGSTIKVTDGTTTLTGTGGTVEFALPNYGTWTITATLNSQTTEKEVVVDTVKLYDETLSYVKIYGVKRTVGSSSTAWTRTDDGVGKTATASVGSTAGSSDFSDCYPWSKMVRETLSTGDVMVLIPEFYYQRYVENSVEYIRIADKECDGFVKHPGSGKYVGAYKTSSNNKSVSGASPTVSQTRATFRANAKAKGTGWSQIDLGTWSAIIMLYLVEFADNNAQAKIGRGWCDGHSASINTGACNSVPNLTGRPSGTDGSTDVVYRGIEGIWGNIWEWVDGVNVSDGTYYVCLDSTKFADDTATNYTKLGYVGSTGWSSSYITTEGMDSKNPWAMLPSAAGSGSETTGYADGCWSSTGWRVCVRSGNWNNGSIAGLFTVDLNDFSSYSSGGVGSRLLYNPQ